MTGTLFGETSVQEFRDLRQANLARFCLDRLHEQLHTEMTRQVSTRVHRRPLCTLQLCRLMHWM